MRLRLAVACASVAFGCHSSPSATSDGPIHADASATDASATDASLTDASAPDANPPDAAVFAAPGTIVSGMTRPLMQATLIANVGTTTMVAWQVTTGQFHHGAWVELSGGSAIA